MKEYFTLAEALDDLRKRGFTRDFNKKDEAPKGWDKKKKFSRDEYEIVEFYRFEGMSNPSDNTIVYAIESKKEGANGVLLNAYGAAADTYAAELASRFQFAEHIEKEAGYLS